MELTQHVVSAADDQRWRALREFGGKELLVAVSEALRPVHDERAFLLGPLEQVGGVDVFEVERGVLAHQDDVELAQWLGDGALELVPERVR